MFRRASLLLTPGGLWIALCLAAVFAAVVSLPIAPADFWWHLKAGERLLDGGGLLTTDPYSFTAQGRPFLHQAWLAAVGFAVVERLGGLPWIAVGNALLFLAASTLVLIRCREISGNERIAAFTTFTGFAVSVENWTVRPQTFSILLLSLTLFIVGRYADGRLRARWLGVLPLLVALWANLHGAFVLGILVPFVVAAGLWLEQLGSKIAGERFAVLFRQKLVYQAVAPMPLAVAVAVSVLTACLTPWGSGIYGYVWQISTSPVLRSFVLEWAPTDLSFFPGRVLAAVMLLLLTVIALARRLPHLPDLLLLGVFTVVALSAVRSVLWWGLVAAPVLADLIPDALHRINAAMRRRPTAEDLPETPPSAKVIALVAWAGIALMVAGATPWGRALLPLTEERRGVITADTPVGGAQALLALEPGRRTFHDMQYGSYLIWATTPVQPVFIDPRLELYPYEQWVDYGTIAAGLNTGPLLARYGIDTLLLDRERQAGLIAVVERDSAWSLVYEDRTTRLYRRMEEQRP